MAEIFEILNDYDKYRKNCPLGVKDVYETEFYDTFKTKYPEKFVDEPDMDPVDHPDFDELLQDNKPPSIYKMDEEEQPEWAYKVLKANEKFTGIKIQHGDVVWIGGDQYRNIGIHFWDAKNEKIIPMATHKGDYGHVPKMFAVGKGEGEFSPGHWDGISYYNNLQPYWSSEKKKWFFPLEDCVEDSDDEYYRESE
jgi:hypothetical protein